LCVGFGAAKVSSLAHEEFADPSAYVFQCAKPTLQLGQSAFDLCVASAAGRQKSRR